MKTEQELGECVVNWLTMNGWDVYQEVVCGGPRADIVALRNDLLYVIECKMKLSLDLIAQGYDWRNHANIVSVAVPHAKARRTARFADIVLRNFGIGLFQVRYDKSINVLIEPVLNPNPFRRDKLRETLCEGHKNHAGAGTNGGGYWTPFRATKELVEAYVDENPGCFFKDIIDNVKTHYKKKSTARSSIREYIERGIIDIVAKKDGRHLRLYPKTATE